MSMSPPDPLLAVLLALVALGLLDRLGLCMESRGWIYWRKRKAGGSVLGTTFLELQKIFESGKTEHVIEARQGDRKEAPDPLAGLLAEDHREIDSRLEEARKAVADRLQGEALRALDWIWMRLAVHIRAEHKVLFPALAEARPDLRTALQTLREDHDFFMATLAMTVSTLKGARVDWASVASAVEAVHRRLESHNALEEARIYPQVHHLPDGQRKTLAAEATRELADLPSRYPG